jgi:starch synthase
MQPRPLSIAVIVAEVAPFSKSGGLADVAHALPKHLQGLGHDVSVVTPSYSFIAKRPNPPKHIGDAVVRVGSKEYPVRFFRDVLSEHSQVPVYFVGQDELFGNRDNLYNYPDDNVRFLVFNRAVFLLYELLGHIPDVLHCHDWQTGLVPNILKLEYGKNVLWHDTVSVFTIHNLLYQMHDMWYALPPEKRDNGRGLPPSESTRVRNMNFTLRAIRNADAINAVSVRYAEEILTKKFGEGLDAVLRRRRDRVFGIINGIDYTIFNPSFDEHLKIHYDWNSLDKKMENKLAFQHDFRLPERRDIPLVGLVHRLTEQKGFDLIMEILPVLLRLPLQLSIVGSGDREFITFFRKAARRNPDKVVLLTPFTEELGSRVYASSDMFLMPSRYEPCGISQLKSLRYGSIPIVHRTGGLADTITDFDPRTGTGTGFAFDKYTGPDLLMAMTRAVETYKYPRVWEHLTWQAMRQSFSWELPARQYVDLYHRAIATHHALE